MTEQAWDTVAELHAYADRLSEGTARWPAPGLGCTRIGGYTVVPVAIHRAICGWRVQSAQDTTPDVAYCWGCHLAMFTDELCAAPPAPTKRWVIAAAH
ncbi:hypothetical protein [Tenggerimyces flavus]|uniref:Uncharacterized protein n=1 Tax=Tenggerimyces flavus TaxID=1708749 RepID=A0ABV7Y9K5_9ACTN|nr:hypothetical protein [Tenggerimyces flavus]MBM7783567.1 hypothetical protein [Tenggerimyces flavus]